MPRAAPHWAAYAWATLLVCFGTALGAAARSWLALTDVVMLYLVVVMITAARFSRGPSLWSALLGVASYDFFFVPPYHTFAVVDASHILTFCVMLAVGLIISGLTGRIRLQERAARQREERTRAVYALTRDLGAATDAEGVATIILEHCAGIFGAKTALLLPNGDGVEVVGHADASEVELARWVLAHKQPGGRGTEHSPSARSHMVPLSTGDGVLGALALDLHGELPDADQRRFIELCVRQCALALARARAAEQANISDLRARTEEMRSSLLSTVSHDLRTPLGAITGAATTLRDNSSGVPALERRELLDTICDEAERLERLVSNLLDMTRVQSGNLDLRREWVPLDEVVGAALTRLEPRLGDREIQITLPFDTALVPIDPVLIEHVFVNLLENALKYSADGGAIVVDAHREGERMIVSVRDHGRGFDTADMPHLFEKFHRGKNAGSSSAGLGLAIVRGVVEAHGGTVLAENAPDGGGVVSFVLPLPGGEPRVAEAEPERVGALP